jgi:tryptophan synthase beta chain
MVRNFQRVIGVEARAQVLKKEKRLPDYLVAAIGGGSNSIGLFHEFLNDRKVKMVGVEAGGLGTKTGKHAARFAGGSPGILHGTLSYVLQDRSGQITETYSMAAGLDYPSIGPEHAWLHQTGRVEYTSVTDKEALHAFKLLSAKEGIIPAFESAHALAYGMKLAARLPKGRTVIINLSGRGDKDLLTNIDK